MSRFNMGMGFKFKMHECCAHVTLKDDGCDICGENYFKVIYNIYIICQFHSKSTGFETIRCLQYFGCCSR